MNAVLLFYHNSKISKVGIPQLTFWFWSFLDLTRSLEINSIDYTSDVWFKENQHFLWWCTVLELATKI